MVIPEIIEDLLVKYTRRIVPLLEEPHFDQKKDEAYVVAVLRDLDELDEQLQKPVYRRFRHTLESRIDFKIWCIKRQDVVIELHRGASEVAEALKTMQFNAAFDSITKNLR